MKRPRIGILPAMAALVVQDAAAVNTLRGSELSASTDSSSSTDNGERYDVSVPQHLRHDMMGSNFVGVSENVANVWEPYDEEHDRPFFVSTSESRSRGSILSTEDEVVQWASCFDWNVEDIRVLGTPESLVPFGVSADDALDQKEKLNQVGIVATPYLHQVSEQVLSREHQGRAFLIMEDPIHIISGQIQNYQIGDEPISVLDFLSTDELHVDNSMVRQLVGKGSASIKLTDEDLEVAKSILSHKVLLGLMSTNEHYQETLDRFSKYFGWILPTNHDDGINCQRTTNGIVSSDLSFLDESDLLQLTQSEHYDVALYEFAHDLFKQQGLLFEDESINVDIV